MNPLPSPALYTPWIKGVYEVNPGLRPFGTDFGNGVADKHHFQLDTEFEHYQSNKRNALRERRGKYVRGWRLSREVERRTIDLIVDHLVQDYPDRFTSDWEGDARVLESAGRRWVLPPTGPDTDSPALDLLARLVQEDLAIVCLKEGSHPGETSQDWIAYLHLCSPSHWAAEDKIGQTFFDTHVGVPGFERTNAVAPAMVQAMVHQGPFVRFVWGVESDNRLNHHPEPAPGYEAEEWHGRDFSQGRFWVRTERQVIWGMPDVGAALFTIRVGHVPAEVVLADPELRSSLKRAVGTMSPAALAYKGLTKGREALLALLED